MSLVSTGFLTLTKVVDIVLDRPVAFTMKELLNRPIKNISVVQINPDRKHGLNH